MNRAQGVSVTRRIALAALVGGSRRLTSDSRETVESVTGSVSVDRLGVTLMHEHIVTDLRAPQERQEGDYDPEEAFETARPFLDELRRAACQTLVELSPMHVGRDPVTLKRLCEASGINIVCATGIYGAANQKFIPDYARRESVRSLADRYVREIQDGIGETKIRPGIIKTGVNRENPLPPIERKLVLSCVS